VTTLWAWHIQLASLEILKEKRIYESKNTFLKLNIILYSESTEHKIFSHRYSDTFYIPYIGLQFKPSVYHSGE
jgi:hypothetical protein